jgi:hypothetical protein
MIRRKDLIDPRMKFTLKEIAIYNARAYLEIDKSMLIIKGQEQWIPPDIKKVTNE